MICFVCDDDSKRVQNHHIIPQARGGSKGPQVPLCSSCHDEVHILAISKIPFDNIKNRRLKKLVKIARLSLSGLCHSDYWKVTIALPNILHKLVKHTAKKSKKSMSQVLIHIIADHFLKKRDKGED